MRVFIGYDARSPVAFNVLQYSIMRRASRPVAITALRLDQLPIARRGLTDFTYSRYLVPWLCDYQGVAVFMDSDMLCLGDVHELAKAVESNPLALRDFGGDMTFERPSMMVFDCAACAALTPDYINDENSAPQSFEWLGGRPVAALPHDWNVLVGYQHCDAPKLLHFTAGIPAFAEMRDIDYAELWHAERAEMVNSVSWLELLGGSRHEPLLMEQLRRKRA